MAAHPSAIFRSLSHVLNRQQSTLTRLAYLTDLLYFTFFHHIFSRNCFSGCFVELSHTFYAKLNKDEAARMEAIKGIHRVMVGETIFLMSKDHALQL
ncbi:uncharacterized protein LOC141627350 isoform X2 [Silene latifolia]|uniref:uncharacterized protein LOC141627350 isoform X2 n=1 Tax=Silene latifolia TaxID=37657 RepID=UPI003D775549